MGEWIDEETGEEPACVLCGSVETVYDLKYPHELPT